MKKSIGDKVIFDASAKTLQFFIEEFNFKYLYAVINKTRNIVIYSPVGTNGITALNGDTITLSHDTTSYADDDILLVLYENNDDITLMYTLLQSFLTSIGWMGNARSATDQMRVNVEAMPTTTITGTLTTVTTVTTVTGITQMGGQNIDTTIAMNLQNLMFANCITNNILIS